jgi:hypothetical protein
MLDPQINLTAFSCQCDGPESIDHKSSLGQVNNHTETVQRSRRRAGVYCGVYYGAP